MDKFSNVESMLMRGNALVVMIEDGKICAILAESVVIDDVSVEVQVVLRRGVDELLDELDFVLDTEA